MNRLNKKLVDQAVLSWNIRFKDAGYTPEQLKLIAREYHEDLVAENFSDQSFVESAKIARRECRFFPKIVDLKEARKVYDQQRARERERETQRALPELSPQQIEANVIRIKQMLSRVGR